ncbi:hypothetical protein ACOME3_005766 [Neoechinorhynchus agilis]
MNTQTTNSDLVGFNVGGRIYCTRRSNLLRYPDTLLGSTDIEAYREGNTYFFDRDPEFFGEIMNYYRTGSMECPSKCSFDKLLDELRFFRLGRPALISLLKSLGTDYESVEVRSPNQYWFQLWRTLTYASESRSTSLIALANTIAVFIIFFCDFLLMATNSHKCDPVSIIIVTIDLTCTIILASETVAIVLSAPRDSRRINFVTVMAFIAIVLPFIYCPFLLTIVEQNRELSFQWTDILISFRIILLCSWMRDNPVVKVLGLTLKKSCLPMLAVILTIFTVASFYGMFVYLFEARNHDAKIKSPANGIYWAIIAMTTVGFGDFYPVTNLGKIVSMLCSVTGLILTSMIIPILSNLYYEIYLETERQRTTDITVKKVLGIIRELDIELNDNDR